MRGSAQREVQGEGPRRRLRTAGRPPVGSDLRRAAGRRGQGQRRWSRSTVRAGPSSTCAAYLEGRPRLPRPASTASAVAPCAPLWSTSCPTTARPTTRPHLPRAVVTLDTPGRFAEFLRVTELDDAEWATPRRSRRALPSRLTAPRAPRPSRVQRKARRECEMDGCGSGDVGQESSLRRDGFPLTGGEFAGRGRYLWGVRDAVRVRRCSLAVFGLPWRDFFLRRHSSQRLWRRR